MSYNRGSKRDSFGNRGFNNRGSGGGGGVGGGVGGGGMNPWEGGMMPGRGILPTPNNNLSMTSQQAQLAIASNLLSNLLRSQQEMQPQVPSLLSLGNNFGGPGPNFRNQQNFGPGRFNDRPMRRPLDNRRPEPYKMGNRARDGPAGRRGPSVQQSRANQSGNQRINGNQIQHRNDKSSKPIPASKQNQTAKKEPQDVKTSDNEKAETPVVKSEENEESEEKKRDWKDEKKEVEAIQTVKIDEEEAVAPKEAETEQLATSACTAEVSKDADTSTTDKDTKATGKKSEARHAESRYADVPMNRMSCHVCNKNMWDGYSFENHLRGRAHLLMMDKLDESYKLKVDLMRHELRVAEEQRELSLNNSKRRGKKLSIDLNVREYCTMCDLNFYGTLSSHRKSEKHQQLKTFLHPRCFGCVKEFPSRIEYDEHCLTPSHMKNMVQVEEQRKNKKKDKLAKGEAEVRSAEEEEKELLATESKDDKDEELPANCEYLTDIIENVKDVKYKIPSLKYCRQNQISVGKSMVKEVQGHYCEKCRRFMLTSEDMAVHIRSVPHYRNFVQEAKSLISTTDNVASKNTEETEANEKESSKDNEEYEGNWKRRKIAHSEDEDASDPKKPGESNDESAANVKKPADGDKKYDPLEADAESEDENHQEEEEAMQDEEENQPDEEKKTPVEKMWADMDNDNDIEIGNLLDDIENEKDHTTDNEETPQKIEKAPIVVATKASRGRGSTPRARGNRARRSRR